MSTNLDTRNMTASEVTPARPRIETQITADLECQRAELVATIDQLYTRAQPAALAQEVKEEASACFAFFEEPVSLTLQDTTGGNAEALKGTGVVTLFAVDAIGMIILLAIRSSHCSRHEARRVTREAAAYMFQTFKSNMTEVLQAPVDAGWHNSDYTGRGLRRFYFPDFVSIRAPSPASLSARNPIRGEVKACHQL